MELWVLYPGRDRTGSLEAPSGLAQVWGKGFPPSLCFRKQVMIKTSGFRISGLGFQFTSSL